MPVKERDYAFVSSILPMNIKNELKLLKYEPIVTAKSEKINSEIAYHPDLRLLKLPDGTWLTDNYEQIVNEAWCYDLIKYRDLKDTVIGGYPNECVLNCFFAGALLFGGYKVADELTMLAERGAFEHVKCRQGYAKCSTAKLNEYAFITADAGIFAALRAKGLDALKVSNDGIKLSGYGCGFFGGCSGKLGDELLVFTGRIEDHVDYENIKSFCMNHKITPYSLSSEPLYDYGGILEV